VHAEQDHFFLLIIESILIKGISEHEEALLLEYDDLDSLKDDAYTLSFAFL
jgi:hypothetical protein